MAARVRAEILATGLTTPVGLGSAQSLAAIGAGVAGFRESSVMGSKFEPLVMALFPEEALLEEVAIDQCLGTSRQRRMLRLAVPALREVTATTTAPLPLFIAGPQSFEERPEALDDAWLSDLSTAVEGAIDMRASRRFATGGAAGLLALEAAAQAIESGVPQVLVGAVDTHLDLYLLATLERDARIQTVHNMDGFIPGEAAAFLLLGRAGEGRGSALASIVSTGIGNEPGHLGSTEPYRGDGLAQAITTALTNARDVGPIQSVYAGLRGDNFGSKEWGVSFLRNRPSFTENFQLEHPADCVGDTGAACGPLMLALAATGLSNASIAGPCLVWCTSDGPERAAVVLVRAN